MSLQSDPKCRLAYLEGYDVGYGNKEDAPQYEAGSVYHEQFQDGLSAGQAAREDVETTRTNDEALA